MAFTVTKFEFRAVGSSQSISFPNTVLNTIVAESLDVMAEMLETRIEAGQDLETAVAGVLKEVISDSSPIIFGGDNYSNDWREEAERRGLLNLRSTMDALPRMLDEKNIELFDKYGVLSETELRAREDILVEQYFLQVNIEAEMTESIARRMVMPAAVRYLRELAGAAGALGEMDLSFEGIKETASHVDRYINRFQTAVGNLIDQNKELGGDSVHQKAGHMRTNVIPAMEKVREESDRLERIVAHDLWPLPVYKHILFVK